MMISGCDCDDDANDSVLGGLVISRMGELLLLAVCKRVVWESVVVVLGSDGSSRLITVAII